MTNARLQRLGFRRPNLKCRALPLPLPLPPPLRLLLLLLLQQQQLCGGVAKSPEDETLGNDWMAQHARELEFAGSASALRRLLTTRMLIGAVSGELCVETASEKKTDKVPNPTEIILDRQWKRPRLRFRHGYLDAS
ncbi:hypothetical protein LX36DRAFT_310613 [Colletotrichum falcatum]|nr:hypothetical protein LX36DRAFT_310613 [Colletotrichum falcatum]